VFLRLANIFDLGLLNTVQTILTNNYHHRHVAWGAERAAVRAAAPPVSEIVGIFRARRS